MGKEPRIRFRWVAATIVAGTLVSSLPVVSFYRAYWPQLTRLDQLVRRQVARDHGIWTPLSRVSGWFPKALIATEDRTFYSNFGVSLEGVGRSLTVDLKSGQFAEGGSTLTQQLVRDTLLTPVKDFRRKLAEALLALAVTVLYSKQQILTMYINQVYLGGGAYGIAMASQRYFGVPPWRLNLPEASLLAGLPQAPSYLDPQVHFQAAKRRQWEVLTSMVADHMITPRQAKAAFLAPLPLGGRPPGGV